MEVFEIVNFILGLRCNNNCEHCFLSDIDKRTGKQIDWELATEIAIEISKSENIKKICFNGGEPFLHFELLKHLIDTVSINKTIKIEISTGAGEFKILEKTIEMIGKLKRIDSVLVSIDQFHLKQNNIENYKYLERALGSGEKITYSICYTNLKDFTQHLLLIKQNNLMHKRIIRQPVGPIGNGKNIKNIPFELSEDIPEDFFCPERNVISIFPDVSFSACSASCVRLGLIKKYHNISKLINSFENDRFMSLRNKYSLKKIAQILKLKGKFNIVTPCSACQSILENLRSG
jgi:organic radical activating enzyme